MKTRTAKTVTITIAVILLLAAICGIAAAVYMYAFNKDDGISADYFADKDVKFIAHRGLSSKYYESSEEAFTAAANSKFFYGIETDVYFTADDVAVCSHDDNAFTDGNVKITSSKYDDIKNKRLKKSSYGYSGKALCRFERYLDICAKHDKVAVIELKQDALSEEKVKYVLDTAKDVCGDKFVIISFSRQNISTVRKLDDSVVTQHLVDDNENLGKSLNEGLNVSDYFPRMTKAVVDDAHGRGQKVGVWTVNSLKEAVRLADYKVDFITTDYDFSKKA